MKFISIDPSLRNTAIVWGSIENGKLMPEDFHLIETVKDSSKKIRVSSDTVRRCEMIIRGLQEIMFRVKPQICFAETPSGSKSSSGMLSYGISCCIIALLSPPPIQLTPIELKSLSVGNKTASKVDIINWAMETFPEFPFEIKADGTPNAGRMEHIADALACAYAGIKTSQFKQLQKFIQ